jgi:hypothetical protein
MPRDEDDESRPEKRRRIRQCKDRMCGADDCPTCRPDTCCHPQNSDERAEMQSIEKYGRIDTRYDHPPIPIRSLDWSATTEYYTPGGPVGHGATEEEAIADLKQQLDDEE